jgi:hypothetical protein
MNKAKININKGTTFLFSGTYYCGRYLGTTAIPGSDGRCGPNNGP